MPREGEFLSLCIALNLQRIEMSQAGAGGPRIKTHTVSHRWARLSLHSLGGDQLAAFEAGRGEPSGGLPRILALSVMSLAPKQFPPGESPKASAFLLAKGIDNLEGSYDFDRLAIYQCWCVAPPAQRLLCSVH